MSDQTDAEPVAYALYDEPGGPRFHLQRQVSGDERDEFHVVPLYARPGAEKRAEEAPCHHQNAAYLRMMEERDALAAVVETVHSWFGEYNGEDPGVGGWYALEVNLEAAPIEVLREVKAAAWDEGYRSGYIEGQADAHRLDPDDIEETPNPYADSPRHNGPQRREEQS